MSTAELWSAFLVWCGSREPNGELLLEYAKQLTARGRDETAEARYATIVAILRTRLACNSPAAQSTTGVRRARQAGYGASRRMLS
jgi:hypothetical protein